MECELHGDSVPELHHLCATTAGRYFEHGLLHPAYDYEAWARPWLNDPPTPEDGRIEPPDEPGLGYDVDWEFVEQDRVDEAG